jgi:hypothetical protein
MKAVLSIFTLSVAKLLHTVAIIVGSVHRNNVNDNN